MALARGGKQRRPGLTIEGVGEGFRKEVFSELGLGDDDGEVAGGQPEEPPSSRRGRMVGVVPAGALPTRF